MSSIEPLITLLAFVPGVRPAQTKKTRLGKEIIQRLSRGFRSLTIIEPI
jgi:hypothetical protein